MKEILYPFRQKKTVLQIVVCTLVFIGMAVPFKSMSLVEGFTEVRPVNAVPVVVGLLYGPAGAWGCAIGNVIADLFGSFSKTSILGFAGNFIAAYLPYKLWHILRYEQTPNVKNYKNIGIYIFISAIGALATGTILTCGLDLLFGIWLKQLFVIICLNDFFFPIFLGLPVFIVLTCDDYKVSIYMPKDIGKYEGVRKVLFWALVLSIISILFMICLGYTMSSNCLMLLFGGIFLVSLVGIII
ncbi:QueT transporter family protein [Anaerotignum sp.]|uniref:QueT transporter family protein n=1 Tax=Anaerotignum sp. TaxID=2039241 RepID=UPI00271479DE|nr:QueT transporter family protein [Anaerotignum sp.]